MEENFKMNILRKIHRDNTPTKEEEIIWAQATTYLPSYQRPCELTEKTSVFKLKNPATQKIVGGKGKKRKQQLCLGTWDTEALPNRIQFFLVQLAGPFPIPAAPRREDCPATPSVRHGDCHNPSQLKARDSWGSGPVCLERKPVTATTAN